MAAQFNGVIKLDVRDSKPDWTPYELKRAASGAPNVLIVLVDDTGQARWSPFGGRINMPTLQRGIDISKESYLDLEKEAAGALARD